MTTTQALSAYRHILQSIRIAFSNDLRVLSAARAQARTAFESSRSLDPTSTEAKEKVQHAEGVAEVLKKNVVQGVSVDGDTTTLKLNIHQHTERGDNDTVKNPLAPGGKVKIGGGCG